MECCYISTTESNLRVHYIGSQDLCRVNVLLILRFFVLCLSADFLMVALSTPGLRGGLYCTEGRCFSLRGTCSSLLWFSSPVCGSRVLEPLA